MNEEFDCEEFDCEEWARKKWAAKETWTLEEAAALLLGDDPETTNIKELVLEELRLLEGPVGISYGFNWNPGPEGGGKFALQLAWLVDAAVAGTLSANDARVTPVNLISWARTRKLLDLHNQRLAAEVGYAYRDEAADHCSLHDAAVTLQVGVDDIINLGIDLKLGIGCVVSSGVRQTDVSYIPSRLLDQFKAYSPGANFSTALGTPYLEDVMVGQDHFRLGVIASNLDHPANRTVTSTDELFTSRRAVEAYARSQENTASVTPGNIPEEEDIVVERSFDVDAALYDFLRYKPVDAEARANLIRAQRDVCALSIEKDETSLNYLLGILDSEESKYGYPRETLARYCDSQSEGMSRVSPRDRRTAATSH